MRHQYHSDPQGPTCSLPHTTDSEDSAAEHNMLYCAEFWPPSIPKATHLLLHWKLSADYCDCQSLHAALRRYAFLLFHHRDNHLLQMAPPAKRISFQTRQWAKEHNMGDPVAGVYCYANHAE
jgi:hypothetical protein